jgi:hypothetical protein
MIERRATGGGFRECHYKGLITVKNESGHFYVTGVRSQVSGDSKDVCGDGINF